MTRDVKKKKNYGPQADQVSHQAGKGKSVNYQIYSIEEVSGVVKVLGETQHFQPFYSFNTSESNFIYNKKNPELTDLRGDSKIFKIHALTRAKNRLGPGSQHLKPLSWIKI